MSRWVIMDTETTGLEPSRGHRIIEIGGVEVVNRRLTGRHYHQYIQPDRAVDQEAFEVHGIGNDFLADKPRFEEVVDEFLDFIQGSELVIHNAPFDVGFLNYELEWLNRGMGRVEDYAGVIDSLAVARKLHPGQKNSLDALCRRYGINNEHRELHGALLDSEILADVYLAMTGGQSALLLDGEAEEEDAATGGIRRLAEDRAPLRVIRPSEAELDAHREWVGRLDGKGGEDNLWRALGDQGTKAD